MLVNFFGGLRILVEALIRSHRIIVGLFLVVARVSWIVEWSIALLLIWVERMRVSDTSLFVVVRVPLELVLVVLTTRTMISLTPGWLG